MLQQFRTYKYFSSKSQTEIATDHRAEVWMMQQIAIVIYDEGIPVDAKLSRGLNKNPLLNLLIC